VTDVAVALPWRRRGLGRELLRRLLRATRAPAPRLASPAAADAAAGPDSVAAFPPPSARAFFACVVPIVCADDFALSQKLPRV
jgi:hypothetical protein